VEGAQADRLLSLAATAVEDDEEFEVLAYPGPGCDADPEDGLAPELEALLKGRVLVVTDGESVFTLEVRRFGPLEKD